jgi:CHAT domain-containing protein
LLASVFFSGWGLSACHAAATPDPGELFQKIYNDYLHGNLDIARATASQARKDFSTGNLQNDPAWGLRFRLLEAEILLHQDHAKDALLLLSSSGRPAQQDLAIKYSLLLGRAHRRLGQARECEEELREAHRLAEAAHSPLIGEVLHTEGLIELHAGHIDAATAKFRSSLASAREYGNPLLQASDLVDIGADSLDSGHFDEALLQSQEAADFAQSVQARRELQLAWGNMGWAYYNLGDFENALANFRRAEQLAREIGMTVTQIAWRQDAGLAHYKLGLLQEARKDEEEALRAALAVPAKPIAGGVVSIQTNLALLLYEQGEYPAAKTHSDAAALAARDSKDNNVVAYVGFVQGLLATRLASTTDAEHALLSALQAATDPDLRTDIEDALANLYAGRHQRAEAQLWYSRAIQTFENKRATERDEALRLAAFGYGAGVYRDYAEFLVSSNRSGEALQLLDRGRARTLEEGLGITDADSRMLAQGVGDPRAVARKLGATILFYALGPQDSYLWAITARETHLFVLPASKHIQSWVAEYQKAILKSGDPVRMATPAGIALYDALVKPAAALLRPDSRVFLIPDGILHELNFETLLEPTADGYRYWIERVTLTTASSIRMLARSKAPAAHAATRDLLLIGNPTAAPSGLDPLPNAANEIQRIQQHFAPGSPTVLTQARAIPAAYAGSGPYQYRYIHFVAHGTASRLSPLDSAVVLSPPRERPADFKLYARDIVKQPLNASLVTISTCYGSGIRTYAGEGLVGLAWVFLRAGSHNVIGALWQADDASTPLLMDKLYEELQAGKPPDIALRAAKLALIRAPNVYRKPFYWGPFQLYSGS